MRRLFRAFERRGLRYLLISGQASILYGAATFSEDVDVWIEPSVANARKLLLALAACNARVYKLTPTLTLRNLLFGHGFHFTIPARPLPIYLDVMAVPPRVGAFAEAAGRARLMQTEWGRIPVVAVPDLIALKQTRRHADYDVISNLVRIACSTEGLPPISSRQAARITYHAEDRAEFLRRAGRPRGVDRIRKDIATEVARLQKQDAAYWSKRIADLRRLRRAGHLLPEGTSVRTLLQPRSRPT